MKSEYKMTCDIRALGVILVSDVSQWDIHETGSKESNAVIKYLHEVFNIPESEEPIVIKNYKGLIERITPNLIHTTIACDRHTKDPAGICIGVITTKDQPRGYVFVIAVAQKERGKGLGYILLSECLEWFGQNNVSKADLDVETDNLGALKLYERCGFKVNNE